MNVGTSMAAPHVVCNNTYNYFITFIWCMIVIIIIVVASIGRGHGSYSWKWRSNSCTNEEETPRHVTTIIISLDII